jgi:hypothetical protein
MHNRLFSFQNLECELPSGFRDSDPAPVGNLPDHALGRVKRGVDDVHIALGKFVADALGSAILQAERVERLILLRFAFNAFFISSESVFFHPPFVYFWP